MTHRDLASPDVTPRHPLSISGRLLVAQVGVVAAMAVTVVGVAALIGPAAFDQHMMMAGHTQPDVLLHAEEAFRSAGLTAIAAGLTMAGFLALAASVLVTRRIAAGLTALARGAERVAEGDYATSVTLPRADRELATVARSFNAMAARLADVEATRRRLLTDLSHELRTPLAAIDLVLEGVEDGVVPADATTLATLRAQTARLARLASDIRQVSAAEEGRLDLRPERVRVADLLAAAVHTALPGCASRGVRPVVDDDDLPDVAVDVDRARIGQLLDNLLRNAVQHTPSGGTVTVWADAHAGLVRLGVRDTGSGIDPGDLPHVFERFYRGAARRHDEGAGTGVGLAISRAIAAAHGGTLTAASDGPGLGSEFVLTLPVA